MSIFEFDQELHDKTLREEEYSLGYNQGKDDGYNQGKDDGYNQGKDDGYEKLSTLINRMIEDGHTDAISKVTTDKTYRDEMLKKYNI